MLQLIAPTTDLYAAWFDAHQEWGPGLHEDGFGLTAADDVSTAVGFTSWVGHLQAAEPLCVSRWIVATGRVLGGIALRLQDNEFALRHGHIGYGIRPSARGRHLAAWALERMLVSARRSGLERVLAVCEFDNVASARTIERVGGELDEGSDLGEVRRYWIDTNNGRVSRFGLPDRTVSTIAVIQSSA